MAREISDVHPDVMTDQSKSLGTIMIVLSLMLPFLLLIGVARRSYFVVAIPVALMVTIMSGISLWAGYTMVSAISDESETYEI